MRNRCSLLSLLALLLLLTPGARAQETADAGSWQEVFGSIPILDGGRVMPLDTYARRLAVEITGRTKWPEDKGPEGHKGREAIELLADLLANGDQMMRTELIYLDHHDTKADVGLDPDRRFFQGVEIMRAAKINEIVTGLRQKQATQDKVKPSAIERHASDALNATMTVATFARGMLPLPIVPQVGSPEFLSVSATSGPPGTEKVQAALGAFLEAYRTGNDPAGAARALRGAINDYAPLPESAAQDIRLEHFYNHHKPWLMAAVATILSLLLILCKWILRLKVFGYLAGVAIAWAVVEQGLGLSLRVMILNRPPVSNTYEAILWIGIVAMGCGIIGQAINRKGLYLVTGLTASLVALLFAQLVPLTDQTNSIPAVLRSNYWLIIHVMTIVASYGAFLLAAVLGHAYLVRDVILRRAPDPKARLIVQTYRLMQVGLVLLTVGTILGGVWAAESWGRFWGWDPKETWSLICIVLYFVMLHARYSGWVKDFGLAVAAVLGFLSIVWCFYGVNYVMATGLHSYGFGSGGEKWVFLAGLVEIAFLLVCFGLFKTFSAPPAAREATKPDKAGGNPAAPTPA
ncbi:MAG: cytochrome c biogenesis protein CcsA [Phycisphaerales bacterium]|nr:cytochrome c biogenesis protein CcsA [Phycisphaerales bacterium]